MKSRRDRWGAVGGRAAAPRAWRRVSPPVKIGFIGGGNMGEALIAAILRGRLFRPNQIGLHEPDPSRLKKIKKKYKVCSFDSNSALVAASQTILLAVKPQQMAMVLNEIRSHLTKGHLLLSIAAGIDTGFFQKRLPAGTRLIRIMPNVCAMIGEGAAALYAVPEAKRSDRLLALKIFSASGKAVFVDHEEWLDVVTAVSGSGPAFIYLFMDALIEAGEKLGLPSSLGKTLVLQTVKGSAKMVEEAGETIASLIEKVASKGGTTEAGLKVLAEFGLRDILRETIAAAFSRAKELRCIS